MQNQILIWFSLTDYNNNKEIINKEAYVKACSASTKSISAVNNVYKILFKFSVHLNFFLFSDGTVGVVAVTVATVVETNSVSFPVFSDSLCIALASSFFAEEEFVVSSKFDVDYIVLKNINL